MLKMKLYKLLIAIVAGVTLSLFTTYNASASKKPNYAYTLTRAKQHTVKLTNTGRTENMYRVTVKRGKKTTWYYMALNAKQSWTVKQPNKYSVTVRRVSKSDEKRNANPRNHFTPAGIKNTQRTVWNR
ncbi:hypothetical protein [Lactobacillus phage Semele]|uniref:Uncharacterized protein n=1 Tax=Lactobacillus phage Semele TaxID=2079433 RepID=A0A2K9VD66_9CAUD|nr:hypothetical protein HOS80_gp120 [Lactobacillus phage Semele]AUV60146.1 hypothetical protein [Lactobacillus phage Semele]